MHTFFGRKRSYRYSFTLEGKIALIGWFVGIVGLMILLLFLGTSAVIVLSISVASLMVFALVSFRPGLVGSNFLPARKQLLAQINTAAQPQPPQLSELMSQVYPAYTTVVAFANGDVWRYGDFRHTETYNAATFITLSSEDRYFSVIEIDMGRELPAIVFASKNLKARDFSWVLHDSQKASLEGDFDDAFDTYFPIHYHIDARSVISPEVMQALLELKDCDIEFSGTKLYVYCVTPDHDMIVPMIEKALGVRQKLIDHVVYYRDELLGDAQDRYNVSSVGDNLRQSGKNHLLGALLFLTLGALVMFLGVVTLVTRPEGGSGELFEAILMVTILPLFMAYLIYDALSSYRDTQKENRQKDEEFEERTNGK